MQLFKAEAPGPSHDKITPRVSDTARRLWFLYVGLTLLQTLLLLPAMSTFDAVNHAFTSMSTGGFSTKNGSVGQFESIYVEWVIIIFMMIGRYQLRPPVQIDSGQCRRALQRRRV